MGYVPPVPPPRWLSETRCEYCGRVNPVERRTCMGCGAPLAQPDEKELERITKDFKLRHQRIRWG